MLKINVLILFLIKIVVDELFTNCGRYYALGNLGRESFG